MTQASFRNRSRLLLLAVALVALAVFLVGDGIPPAQAQAGQFRLVAESATVTEGDSVRVRVHDAPAGAFVAVEASGSARLSRHFVDGGDFMLNPATTYDECPNIDCSPLIVTTYGHPDDQGWITVRTFLDTAHREGEETIILTAFNLHDTTQRTGSITIRLRNRAPVNLSLRASSTVLRKGGDPVTVSLSLNRPAPETTFIRIRPSGSAKILPLGDARTDHDYTGDLFQKGTPFPNQGSVTMDAYIKIEKGETQGEGELTLTAFAGATTGRTITLTASSQEYHAHFRSGSTNIRIGDPPPPPPGVTPQPLRYCLLSDGPPGGQVYGVCPTWTPTATPTATPTWITTPAPQQLTIQGGQPPQQSQPPGQVLQPQQSQPPRQQAPPTATPTPTATATAQPLQNQGSRPQLQAPSPVTPTPTPVSSPLTAPALTAKVKAGENAVELSWEAVPGAVRYELRVWWDPLPAWQPIGGTDGTSYTHSGLTAGRKYYYTIRAVNAAGKKSDWLQTPFPTATVAAEQEAPTPTPTPQAQGLTAPALTAKVKAGENAVELSWEAVPGAVRYELRVWWDPLPAWQPIGGTDGTSYTHSGLTAGRKYYYTIRAVNAAGEKSDWLREPFPTATVPE